MGESRRKQQRAKQRLGYDPGLGEEQIIGQEMFGGKFEQVITSGGMSTILVILKSDGKRIAVKSLPRARYKNLVLKRRFEAEAKAWLFIPVFENIVTAHKYVTVQGRPFVFMDYYPCGDLMHYAERNNICADPQLVLEYALQICDATSGPLSVDALTALLIPVESSQSGKVSHKILAAFLELDDAITGVPKYPTQAQIATRTGKSRA